MFRPSLLCDTPCEPCVQLLQEKREAQFLHAEYQFLFNLCPSHDPPSLMHQAVTVCILIHWRFFQ